MNLLTKRFLYFIFALTIFRLIYIYFLPVIPQEAYYWYYSRHIDWSYFDHPPITAYSIWLGTLLFGNTVFGVKFMAVIWSLLTNIMLFLTAREAGEVNTEQSTKMAFTVVILYNLTIYAHLYAMIMVPDTPLIFFWITALFFIQRALQNKSPYYWLWTGIAMGLGLLSKYTMIALLPAVLFILILFPKNRHWFKSVWPYLALVLMFVMFWQVIYWNDKHNWSSFTFQFSERAENTKHFQTKYFFQLVGSQAFLLSPLFFFWFFWLSSKIKTMWEKNYTALYYFITGIFLIAGFIFISLYTQVKMNWLLPGYSGFFIALVLLYNDGINWHKARIKSGIIISLVLIVLLHIMQLIPNIPLGEGNTWSGWKNAAKKIYTIQQEKGGKENCFIFSNSYKSSSLLKFYLPDQQDTYAQNIYDRPALQFDIWGTPKTLTHKDALYIISDRKEYSNDLEYIKPFFDSVELIKTFKYSFADKYHTRTIFCYYAKNYKPFSQE